MIAPELFTQETGQYLGLYSVARQLEAARTDDALREVVASLWSLAVTIEDGNISDVDKALRQLAEQLRNNPQQLARPLDPNTRILSQQDLKNMLDRLERMSRSGDK